MMKLVPVCLTASLAIAGCTTLPKYFDYGITAADIVVNAKCQLLDAVTSSLMDTDPDSSKFGKEVAGDPRFRRDHSKWLDGWGAGFTLTLIVLRKGGGSGDASLVVPVAPSGTFTIGFKGGLTSEAKRTEKIEFNVKLDEAFVNSETCERERGKHLLAGDLGIKHLFDHTVLSEIRGQITPSGLTHELQFLIKANSSVTPKFAMIPVGGNVVGGSLGVESSRDDTHTLNIVFKKPATKTVLNVRIVQDVKPKPGDDDSQREGVSERTETRRTIVTEDFDTTLDRARLLDRLDSLNIE